MLGTGNTTALSKNSGQGRAYREGREGGPGRGATDTPDFLFPSELLYT